jgi:hypothetical protein
MPGLYDNDELVDFVTYEPETATFRMKLSGNNYATERVITFPSTFIADASSSTGAGRAGAVPYYGLYQSRDVGHAFVQRLALSLWDPGAAQLSTIWAPDTSTTVSSCTPSGFTSNLAVTNPLAGLGSRFPTAATAGEKGKFTLFSASNMTDTSSSPSSTIYQTVLDSCRVAKNNLGTTKSSARVFPVSDMTGDGYPELIYLDTDGFDAFIQWSTSESGYSSFGSVPCVPNGSSCISYGTGDATSVFL